MKVALTALLLAGCHADYCERSEKIAEDCGEVVSDEVHDQCEEALSSCNGEDQKALNDTLDCFEEQGLTACGSSSTSTPATGSETFTEDFGDLFLCIAPLATVSEECVNGLDAFGGSTTFTSTSTTGSTN